MESSAHRERTEATFYGTHDPLGVPISPCARCGTSKQKVWKPKNGKPLWRVVCFCGTSGDSCMFPRKAVFRWNKSNKSRDVRFQDSPLFHLKGLTESCALTRIQSIHNDLALKIEIARVKIQAGDRVASGYLARLVAYSDWARYLEVLIGEKLKLNLST